MHRHPLRYKQADPTVVGGRVAAVHLYQRKGILIRAPIVVLALVLMAVIWSHWMPMPPSEITLSAGRSDGIYFAHAQRYAQEFARRGVTVRVLESEGAQQNLDRLLGRDPAVQEPVHLAFMQGGVGYPPGETGGTAVRTIANVDIEPVWVFSRAPGMDSMLQLQGQRVSLGPRGSGTRRVALHLLEQVRMKPTDVVDSDIAGMAMVQALREGSLDAAVMVSSPQSPVIHALLKTPGVWLVQLRRSAAILDRLPYLQARLLAQGALDDTSRVPATDIGMLTTLASLVVRGDLDPALQRMAAEVAREVHAGAGKFHRSGEFPALRRADFPVSPQAREVLTHGLPWLERSLPFWWAQVLTRVLLVCLPVALLAWWAARLIPAYLRWVLESRVIRWYGELKYIEHDLQRDAISGIDLSRHVSRLADIDRRVVAMRAPADLRERWFTLRQHIDFVRMGLYRRRGR